MRDLERFSLFCLMGIVTFLADAVLFYVLLAGLGLAPLLARILTLPFALTLSWFLNRRFTFKQTSQPSWKEWSGFCFLNTGGAVANVAVFAGIMAWWGADSSFAALVAGTLAGLMFNFIGSRFVVFR